MKRILVIVLVLSIRSFANTSENPLLLLSPIESAVLDGNALNQVECVESSLEPYTRLELEYKKPEEFSTFERVASSFKDCLPEVNSSDQEIQNILTDDLWPNQFKDFSDLRGNRKGIFSIGHNINLKGCDLSSRESYANLVRNLQTSLNTGMSTLKRYGRVHDANSLASLFTRENNKKGVTIICGNQELFQQEEVTIKSGFNKSYTNHTLAVGGWAAGCNLFPKNTLFIGSFQYNTDQHVRSAYNDANTVFDYSDDDLQCIIFHEFLHLIGYTHAGGSREIFERDVTYTASACAFPDSNFCQSDYQWISEEVANMSPCDNLSQMNYSTTEFLEVQEYR